MPEESKERSPRKLAKSRRDYLAQAKMLTEDERTQEAAEINKALGIKAPKGSNAEVKAEVTRFREQLDQMQLQMLGPKPRKRPSKSKTADRSSTLT